MVTLPILLSVLAASTPQAQAGKAPTSTLPPSMVVIGTAVYDGGGRISSASSAPGAAEMFVFTRGSVCAPATISAVRPTDATYGWRVSVQFRSFNGASSAAAAARPAVAITEVGVLVRWQRLWNAGRDDKAVERELFLALRPGDRVPLDNIPGSVKLAQCGPTSTMTLSIAPASVVVTANTGGGRATPEPSGPKSSAVAGGVGGFVKGRPALSDGRSVPASTLNYAYSCDNSRLGNPFISSVVVTDAGGCAAASSDLNPTRLQVVTVDVWLVHRAASGATEQSYRRITTTPADGRFGFPAVTFETPDGTRTLEVSGFAQAERAANGTERLEIAFARRTAVVIAGSIGTGIGVGAGSRVIDMPRPGEVVSIELPPAPGALPGDQFSLRVRIAP